MKNIAIAAAMSLAVQQGIAQENKFIKQQDIQSVFLKGVDENKRPAGPNIAVNGYDDCKEFKFVVDGIVVWLYDCLTKKDRFTSALDSNKPLTKKQEEALLEQLKK